jgi:geranylgeranyl pyrophosphate synthase
VHDCAERTAAVIRRVDAYIVQAVEERTATRQVGLKLHAEGGKRLRTRVAATVANLGDVELDRLARGAAALELLHLATLVHDDVIDESDQRRGVPTTWSMHGAPRAIVVGDSLFGAAFELANHVSKSYVAEVGQAIGGVCDGQMEELDDVGDPSRSSDRVEYVAALKTGSLFGTAVVLGAIVAKSDDIDAARTAGTRLGTLYQLLDDLEDIDAASGAHAADLVNGLTTQPWILAADRGIEHIVRQTVMGKRSTEAACLLQSLWDTNGPTAALERIITVSEHVAGEGMFAQHLSSWAARFQANASAIVARNTPPSS